jgi:hypothetical protein
MSRIKCAVCNKNPVKTKISKHWKTNKIIKLYEATCNGSDCVNQYNEVLAELSFQEVYFSSESNNG